MKKRTILYIRVSTDDQTNGYSPADQEERLRRYCLQNDIEIVAVFWEDESAKDFDNRPEWQKILVFIKKNRNAVNSILFVKWDRFSRNVAEAYITIRELRKYGVEPQAMEQPLDFSIPESKIMLAVYLAAPEVDNDRRALNTLHGMRKAKKEGRWVTTPLRGYKMARDERNKPIMIPEGGKKEQLIRKAFTEFATGLYTIEELRRQLNKEGLNASRNNFWDILRNRAYTGKIFVPAFKDEAAVWVNGIHEPLVSEEVFYQVQDILDGRKNKKRPSKNQTQRDELPLRGFLTCPQCGGNLTGSASTGRLGGKFFYYHCRKGCKERQKANEIDNVVLKMFNALKSDKEGILLLGEVLKQNFKANSKQAKSEIQRINEELQKIETRLKNARILMLDGELSAKEYKELKSEMEDATNKLRNKQNQLVKNDEVSNEEIDLCVSLLLNIDEYFKAADIETKQQLVGSVFPEKMIISNGKCRTQDIDEAVKLLCLNDKELQGGTNKKHPIYEVLSCGVACGLSLSNFIEDFNRIRKLKSFMELKQF